MTDSEQLAALTHILQDLLGDDSIELTMDTTQGDVPGWDSFCNVNFIVAIEEKFHIEFPIADIETFDSVGAIVRAIDAHQKR